jgi:hypothetical protein
MPKREQTAPARKMSDIMKEMTEQLFRDPDVAHSSEALHVALFFANVAWNECVGLVHDRQGYRSAWETIEAANPELWNELKSNDTNGMIDELVAYKKAHFPNDGRRILICGGTPHSTIHVEWLPPAAPGVDTKWEMRLYGLVRMGQEKEAVRFLEETRKMSRNEAKIKVGKLALELGMM